MAKRASAIALNGYSLDLKLAQRIACGDKLSLATSWTQKVSSGRKLVEKLASGSTPIYGINTGFGYLAHTRINLKDLKSLQANLIISHAGGTGAPLSIEEARLIQALKLNLFLKGHSGVRVELCQAIYDHIASGIQPIIPECGSVGASGDLIPLSHAALPLIGEGDVYFGGKIVPAKKALKESGLKPIELLEKEGIALINGTEVMQAVGGLALAKAIELAELADKITALTFEGMGGLVAALDPLIHKARGQVGQIDSANSMLKELKGSYLFKGAKFHDRVQDPYSLRCAPQVHGPARDALHYAKTIIERELNAATDNPLVFAEEKKVLSGGNFHGENLAMAFDFAAIACSELANISERRIELLVNPQMSGLPAFLAPEPGKNSGYMALQYQAASLVSENKILAHPASTDSIPGNVGIEDFVSMGMTSARKLRQIVQNTTTVLALELLAAAQAVHLRKIKKLGAGTARIYKSLRKVVKPLGGDRIVADDIQQSAKVIGQLLEK